MPQLFLPEIEQYAEKDPLLYEIFYQIQSTINKIPISSGAATPTPVAATDPTTGLPLTDSSGNPLFTIPSVTDQNTTGSALPSAQVPANENGLYMQTDPLGGASNLFAFGGVWQSLMKIIRASDLAGKGAAAKTFLTVGAALAQGLQYDSHGRPTSSFFTNAVDNLGLPLTNPLSQSGTSTTILVASTTWQFGGFTVSFNSGSVDPGAFGTYNVFADDPQYNGGAITYMFAVPGSADTVKKRGRFFFGQITTVSGGGGGGTGGGNGGGGRGYV